MARDNFIPHDPEHIPLGRPSVRYYPEITFTDESRDVSVRIPLPVCADHFACERLLADWMDENPHIPAHGDFETRTITGAQGHA